MSIRSAQRLGPETSTSGAGDVLDELEQDHRMVETLFAQAALVDGEARRTAIDEIVTALTVHASVEEEVVYPAIESSLVDGEVLAARSLDEHDQMKELLARLDAAEPASPEGLQLLWQLQLVVQAHVAVEEAELWPAYRTVVEPSVLADLTDSAKTARIDANKEIGR